MRQRDKVTFLRDMKDWMDSEHFSNLSAGSRASINTVSSSMPAKDKICAGPQVFSGAIGMPRKSHIWRKRLSWLRQRSWDGALIWKSSNKWIIKSMSSFSRAIHSKAVLESLKRLAWTRTAHRHATIVIEQIPPFHAKQMMIWWIDRYDPQGNNACLQPYCSNSIIHPSILHGGVDWRNTIINWRTFRKWKVTDESKFPRGFLRNYSKRRDPKVRERWLCKRTCDPMSR